MSKLNRRREQIAYPGINRRVASMNFSPEYIEDLQAESDPHVLLGRIVDAATDLAHLVTRKTDQRAAAAPEVERIGSTKADEQSAAHPTPRTDARTAHYADYGMDFVPTNFARELERESGGLRKARQQADHERDGMLERLIAAEQRAKGAERDAAKVAKYLLWHTSRVNDHACAQCVPNGELVKEGFICGYHTAVAIDAALEEGEKNGT